MSTRKEKQELVKLYEITSASDENGDFHPKQEHRTYADGLIDAMDILLGKTADEILKDSI